MTRHILSTFGHSLLVLGQQSWNEQLLRSPLPVCSVRMIITTFKQAFPETTTILQIHDILYLAKFVALATFFDKPTLFPSVISYIDEAFGYLKRDIVTPVVYPRLVESLHFDIQITGQKSHCINIVSGYHNVLLFRCSS